MTEGIMTEGRRGYPTLEAIPLGVSGALFERRIIERVVLQKGARIATIAYTYRDVSFHRLCGERKEAGRSLMHLAVTKFEKTVDGWKRRNGVIHFDADMLQKLQSIVERSEDLAEVK